jgi:hypothetical protein
MNELITVRGAARDDSSDYIKRSRAWKPFVTLRGGLAEKNNSDLQFPQLLALHPLQRRLLAVVQVDGQHGVDGEGLHLLGAELGRQQSQLLLPPGIVLPDVGHGHRDHEREDGL